MNRDQKAALVEELVDQLKAAEAVFAVDYRGISVAQAADLRTRLREAETVFRVVKNSLTERATDAAGTQELKPMLQGPTALAFVSGDAALAAKALNDAARAFGALEFKGGLMDGTTLSGDDVRAIARLPAREVLHGQLVGAIASPLSGLVRTLNALISGLARQLGQMAEQGLVSGEAPSAEPQAAAAEAEPAPEPEPAAEAEPDAAAEPEPEAAAEPEPEPEPAEEPAPDAEPEAAAEPQAAQESQPDETEAAASESADEPKEE